MRGLRKILGFFAVIALCLGSAFVILLPANPIFWQISWSIFALLAVALAALNRTAILHFLFHRTTRYGANLFALTFFAVGIALALNYIGANYSQRFDLTSSRRFTLSEQTKKVLSSLPGALKIHYFYQPGPEMVEAQRLLEMLKQGSRNVSAELHHINANPTLARSFGIEKVNQGEQILVLVFEPSSGPAVPGQAADKPRHSIVRGVSEEKIVNGLARLLESGARTVYFLTGHGERGFGEPGRAESLSELKKLVEAEIGAVKTHSFDSGADIPADASALVIAGPKSQLHARELEILKGYLERGGRILVAFDIDIQSQGIPRGGRQLADLLAPYGLSVGDRLLVDTTSQLYKVDGQILLGTSDSASHPITKDFPRTSLAMGFAGQFYFPFVVRLAKGEAPEGIAVETIVKSSQAAWEESSWSEIKSGVVKLTKGEDRQSEMTLAVTLESKRKESPWRVVAFGSSGFFTNGAIFAKHDKDLALNSINWLADRDQMISVRQRELRDVTLAIDANLYNFILLVLMVAMPIAILGTGLWIWFQRRAK